ncbi:MAG TPA: N-6 DNA methylase [Candidatus Angelobacter sp.]
MSLQKYLEETAPHSIASEIGFYTPLATRLFGALLGYPPKQRVINKSGAHGIPDIRLHSQEDDSEWVVVEAKLKDDEIRDDSRRGQLWREQIVARRYIGPETFYIVLCAPRTFYVCSLEGKVLEAIHIEDDHLSNPRTGARFPLADKAFRNLAGRVSYAASMERRQFEAFRHGELPSGHIPVTPETLAQLQAVFVYSIEKLREYCRVHFRQLQSEYTNAKKEIEEIDQALNNLGSGAIKARQKILYRRKTIRARHRLALQLFEDDYDRFKHDQTYAGTDKEENFEDIFCTNTAYVALSRLFFVRICEDAGLTTHKISNSGIAVWREFVRNIKGNYQDLLDVAFKDVAHVYSSLFESSVFDWFGKSNGILHDLLERILFRLNAFDFREINRDLLGSIYQYFRPRIERKRLGEYYTPVEVVDFILNRTGMSVDNQIMQKRILDPACGSFTFGVRTAVVLLRAAANLSPKNKIDLVRTCLRGQDINPFSAFLSHLSLLFALLEIYLDAKKSDPKFEIAPMDVAVQNSLTVGIPAEREMGSVEEQGPEVKLEQFDYVVGNPPFVRNERLPKEDREVLNDLFPSLAVRNTDLSVYFIYAAVKHFTKENGRIGIVAPIAIANTQMAAYLRNILKLPEYEITELVSLEWCAKEAFPGADIVPILIFIKKTPRLTQHNIRLISGLESIVELTRCLNDQRFLASKSSILSFEEWAQISSFGDWCLDVSEQDMPILQKLGEAENFEQVEVARCTFGVKAGNHQKFLRSVGEADPVSGEVPFLKGHHVAAFSASLQVEEYANLAKITTADDASIWHDLEFYEANRGKADTTGHGRQDYRTPHKLGNFSPSDTLCCLMPEIYVTLSACVFDPLGVVANNSTLVLVPKKFSAYCLSAIVNSRISRYYAFLTLRSAILRRRRTTWFPRAIKALRMPKLSTKTAQVLHNLAYEATELSAAVPGSEAEAFLAGTATIAEFKKAAFLGLRLANAAGIDRDDLEEATIFGNEMQIGSAKIDAQDPNLLVLLRDALLATDEDEFTSEDLENVMLPADEVARAKLAHSISDFASHAKRTEARVNRILDQIDEIVAAGLHLTPAEHDIIKKRCQQFPLSVTVERPRFAWSADRKSQKRRVYRPGERFK